MMRECLDTRLRTDPGWLTLKKYKPRLFVRAEDLLLFVRRWHPADVARWTPDVFAANLDYRSVKQFEKDLAELRERGLLEPDSYEPCFAEQPQSAEELRREQDKIRQQKHRAKSETVTGESRDNAVTEPSAPESESGTGPDSVSFYKEPESGIGTGVRLMPPQTLVEQFVALGMEREKAEARIAEFGEERCRDALASLALKPPEVRTNLNRRVGFLVDFLVHKRPLPKELIKQREAEKQKAMTLLSVAPAGNQPARLPEPCDCPPPVGFRDLLKKTGTS
jgi:hypothetical protein